MKKNYLSKTAMSANPLALIVAKKSWKNMTTAWLLLLFTVFGFTDAFGQIVQRGGATTALSTANTITIAKPTGVVAGDIMIANIASLDNKDLSGTNANLAGWTLITASNIDGNTQRRCTILYKIAGAVEPTDYTFNVSNGTGTTDNTSGAIIAYSGVNNTTPFDVTPGTMSSGNGNTVTATTITTVTANAAVIFLSALRRDENFNTWATGTPSSLTLTETYDYRNNNYPGIGSAWAIQSTPGSTGAGSCTLSGSSGFVGILIALRPQPLGPPTITSFTPTSACASSSQTVVITGTNFTGATAVTIGVTAAASYVVNSATQITATIGTGTTGTVQVTTSGGTATSAATFTVHPLPAAIAGGAATVCTGASTPAFTNATAGGTWSVIPGTGTASISAGGVLTGTTAGNVRVRYTLPTGCFVETALITINSLPTTVATPTPTNGATGVCYSGFGAITAISWAASTGATSYDVYFGAGSLPGGITANVTTNSYTFGALTPNTTYYWRVVARNACGSAASSATFTFTTSTTPICYCTPTTSQNLEHITGVASEGTINDVSNPSGYSLNGYGNYTSIIIATQIPGGSININLSLTDITTFERQFVRTWVDWNNDGDFDDTGELVYTTGTTATGTTSYGFLVPAAQALGNYRMRIKTRNIGPPFSGNNTYDSCSSYNRGETEDYTIRVIADCPAKITGITPGSACGPTNTVTLSATMSAGSTQIHWYDALTGGTLVGTGTSFTTPVLSSSTTYYVTASNGSCETIHRTPIKATILSTTDITITPSVPEVCGEDNVVSISALGDNIKETIHTQDFESGLSGYTITTTSGTAGGADAPWSIKTSPYQTTTNVWKPAINSGPVGTVGNRFAFTTSDYSGSNFTTRITSPAIDVSTYTSLTLTFDHFFSRYVDDLGSIRVSTDNGASWTTVHSFTAKDGSASKFKSVLPIDLSFYAGNTQLQIQFQYYGSYDDGWAIDNIKLEGVRPLNTLFTWTGATIAAFADAACTVPYTNQPVTTVYVKPTPSQLAMPSWSFTANATLGNGCLISTPVTITNKTKLWKGTSDNNWYNPNNWEPIGVPDANTCVYIYPGSPAANTSNINTIANDGFAKSVTVRPSGVLNIHPGNDLTVTDAVTVDAGGTFNIESTGSLIQVNNVANSGIISMKRNASFGALDYVYWSSPVANFASSAISPATPTSLIWKWEPTTSTAFANQFGNWVNGNETMTIGRGYIVRSPGGWPTANTTFTANFVGVPNNGTITRPITRWTYTGGPTLGPTSTPVTANDDNWNLLGNPYPSAIDALAFMAANTTHINNFVDLWTHGNAPAAIADPFYQDYQLNYNPNDYLRYNNTGGTQAGFDGKIGAGQGFFVLMRDAGSTTENVTFTNAMRSRTHRNDQFFRTSETNEVTSEIERHRIWLKMVAPNLVSTDMLVGYVAGATNTLDDSFDAMNRGVKVNYELYSLAENQGLLIQGRALPFDSNDQIPLGMAISQNGIHTIAISNVDGLFSETTQSIYLEDLVLGITHDLRTTPYTFTATPGRYDNRFVLKFNNQTLGNNDFVANAVTVYTNENIQVSALNQTIQSVKVYDLLGRVLGNYTNINSNAFTAKNIAKTNTALLVEVTLDNGGTKTYKVIY